MNVKLDNNKVKITFKSQPRLFPVVRSLPGSMFSRESMAWYIPLDVLARDSVQHLAANGFTVEPEVYAAVEVVEQRDLAIIATGEAQNAPFLSSLPLMPYQKSGAKFLYEAGNALLGDEPGLGKTIQTLAVIEARGADVQRVLVFVPAVLKVQWAEEIKKFLGNVDTVVIQGTPDERVALWQSSHKYYIANYEQLLRDIAHMRMRVWDYIVADEATKISNPTGKQAKLIKTLKARYRLALTGTPISNRPEDLWNVMDFVQPGCLGSYDAFIQRYTFSDASTGLFTYKHMDELGYKVRRYMVRRLKEQVLTELPPKIITDVPFQLSDRERKLYNQIREEILFEIEHSDISKMNDPITIQNTLVKMLRLRQLVDSLELIGEATDSTKLEVLREILHDQLKAGRKIIIFTEFSGMADILVRELAEHKPLLISGKDASSTRRQEVVKQFNTNPAHPILVMTSAGQFGLNLQGASVMIHYDQPWSLAKVLQREGRAHRYGQTKSVLVYNLLAKSSVDTYIQRKLFKKQQLAEKILMSDIKEMLNYEE